MDTISSVDYSPQILSILNPQRLSKHMSHNQMTQYSLLERFHGALLGQAIAAQHFTTDPDKQIAIKQCLNWLCDSTQDKPILTGHAPTDSLTLLPLWLYGHESWRQRQAKLEQIPTWRQADVNCSNLWLYGEVIAQVIRINCHPQNLISNILSRWQQHAKQGAPNCPASLTKQLQTISGRAIGHQPDNSIILGLKAFLDSPQDITIALHRITQLNLPNAAIIAQLSGAIIGAHCGSSYFPAPAISRLIRSKFYANTSIEGTDAQPPPNSMLPFSDASRQLLETWAGMPLQPNAITPRKSHLSVLTPR